MKPIKAKLQNEQQFYVLLEYLWSLPVDVTYTVPYSTFPTTIHIKIHNDPSVYMVAKKEIKDILHG
jgi:hypothetical protein